MPRPDDTRPSHPPQTAPPQMAQPPHRAPPAETAAAVSPREAPSDAPRDAHLAREAPHAATPEACLQAFASHPQGLTQSEAAARLARNGPNRLPAPKPHSPWRRFLAQFHNVLIYVLLVASAITLGLGHYVDTGVILAVVLANALIGFVQEGKAEAAMGAIRQMLAPRAAVLRAGQRRGIDGADLVVGDIVLLEPGDRVPADLRLIAAHGLAAQEALLTGESLPSAKDIAANPVAAALGDRHAMLYSGTLITQGSAQALVTATGTATEIGRIGGLLADVDRLSTPLVEQMDRFGRWLSLLILSAAALLLAWGLLIGHGAFESLFMVVVSVAVSAIPEGLPAVMTITLAIGVQAMARRQAIVRRLPAIEAIGAVSVICTDKTGTLTRNEMQVVAAETPEGRFAITGLGYAPEGTITWAPPPLGAPEGAQNSATSTGEDRGEDPRALLAGLAHAALLCNDAHLHQSPDGPWQAEGDPMEAALLALAGKALGDGQQILGPREAWTRRDTIPFDSRHRFMAVLDEGPGGRIIHVKGAPERVLAMCRGLDLAHWSARADAMAAQGQRVLALASALSAGPRIAPDQIAGGLTFLGLVGLIDPPRPEAIAAVAECQAAGIAVKMITGDHAGTAAAIAKAIGLARADQVLTGADLDAMDEASLALRVEAVDVFARTSPEHKLRLVAALQARGHIVAMTGDGVNDAPALKRADAGIAMGLKGSEAAKEAADLVLADDNFATIAAAVREGRTVRDNLGKVIGWTLPTNAGEAAVVVLALLLGLALPITAVQILWINLITGITLGIALAFEPSEAGTMARPPRPRDAPILSGALVWHVLVVAVLFVAMVFAVKAYALDRGHTPEYSQTLVMNIIVVMEIFHLFFIRNLHGTSLSWALVRGTKVIWATVLTITLAQCAITYLPLLQQIFGTRAVALHEGLMLVGLGAAFFALLEIEKQIRLTLRRAAL